MIVFMQHPSLWWTNTSPSIIILASLYGSFKIYFMPLLNPRSWRQTQALLMTGFHPPGHTDRISSESITQGGQMWIIGKTVSLSSGAINSMWASFLVARGSLPGKEANTEENRTDRWIEKQSPDLAIPVAMNTLEFLVIWIPSLLFRFSYFKLCFYNMKLKVAPTSAHGKVEEVWSPRHCLRWGWVYIIGWIPQTDPSSASQDVLQHLPLTHTWPWANGFSSFIYQVRVWIRTGRVLEAHLTPCDSLNAHLLSDSLIDAQFFMWTSNRDLESLTLINTNNNHSDFHGTQRAFMDMRLFAFSNYPVSVVIHISWKQ